LVYTYISGWQDRDRKEGVSLLLVGVEELRKLELPSGWSLRIIGLYPPSGWSQRIQGVVAFFKLEILNRGL
jgi:hypothetical protein